MCHTCVKQRGAVQHDIDHNPLWHRIVPCAMFNVHCVHTLCKVQCALYSHFVQSSTFTVFALCVLWVKCIALSISGGVRVRTLVAVIQSAVWKTSDSCVCATDAAQTCVLTHQGRVSPQGNVFNLCRVIITNKLGHSSRLIPIYRKGCEAGLVSL